MATSAPAGENIQIHIAENGTTTLATAGKYCEANIDVNVNVPGKATQFTNLYDPANVTCKTRIDCSSSTGVQYNTDSQANILTVPYHHIKGDTVVMRLRGISTVRDRGSIVIFAEDGETRVNHYVYNDTTFFTLSYDEYGDTVITFKGNIITTYEWYYIKFNIQYPFYNASPTEPIEGPIITINEPIGNGGHAG